MRSEVALDPIRSLRVSWSALKRAPARLWSGGALLFLGEVGGVSALAIALSLWRDETGASSRTRFAIASALGIALFLCSSRWWIRLARAVERALPSDRASEPSHSPSRVLTMILARLMSEILALLALVPAAVTSLVVLAPSAHIAPGGLAWTAFLLSGCAFVYVVLGLSFVPQVAALEGRGAVASIRISWSLARGCRWRLLVYHGALRVLVALGVCCCFGVFVSGPIVNLSRVESYLALTRERARAEPPA